MAEHVLAANVLLRYDTYSNWMNSDVILKQGEAAVAIFPSQDILLTKVGIKIGNGNSYFYQLPWIQAVAADVYNWAKSSTKPSYSADEIDGLAQYIEQHGGGSGGGSGASSSYRIIYNNTNNKYILQYYDDDTDDWVNTTSEIDFSTVINRLNAIENWANGAQTDIGNIEMPLVGYISDVVSLAVGRLDTNDTAVDHQFVTSVSQNNGKITVSRNALDASDITTGVFTTTQGGTGFTEVNLNEILVGSENGQLQKTNISTKITEEESSNNIPTTGAVISYIEDQTAGLTGAMHFIGEASVTIVENSRVNPQIPGYNFRAVQPGDVILSEAKEFVWTGSYWRLLGDEGSYAIKGSITNVDIAEDANIAISKIANLLNTLDNKVNVQEGKGLSSNDYTTEEKNKLQGIEEGAQANTIEHIFLNEREIAPSVIDGLAKSINLSFLTLTQDQIDKLNDIEANAQKNVIEHIFLNGEEVRPTLIENLANSINLILNEFDTASRDKLNTIEAEAQVNKIEKIIYNNEELVPDDSKTITITPDPHTEHENKIEQIFINGVEWAPNNEKQVKITIDQAALNLNVLEGATVPNSIGREDIEQSNKKLLLERIAASGDVRDLKQTADTYIILDCGSSTAVI